MDPDDNVIVEFDAATSRNELKPKLTVYLSASGSNGSLPDDIKTQVYQDELTFNTWY